MHHFLELFTLSMAGVILFGDMLVILLLGKEALRLQTQQWRAIGGVVGMALILVATATSLIMLTLLTPQNDEHLSQVFLPLTASLLIASLYTLTFPPHISASRSRAPRWRRLLLICFSIGAFLSAAGLVLLDLLSLS